MVRRILGPPGTSAKALSGQVGVGQPTLSRWVREAGSVRTVSPPNDKKPTVSEPKKWSLREKLRVVATAEGLEEHALGELLRREGLHEEQLRAWRDAAAGALDSAEAAPSAAMTAAERRRLKVADKRIRELEKELRRKEKALAETAAMLVLEKKLQALGWDDEDGGTEERNDE